MMASAIGALPEQNLRSRPTCAAVWYWMNSQSTGRKSLAHQVLTELATGSFMQHHPALSSLPKTR